MTFASVALPSVAQRWRLDGPAGPHLDALVARLIGAGVTIEPIVAGTAYRLDGPALTLDVLGDELKPIEGLSLERESPPTDCINMRSDLAPAVAPRRSVTVHGVAANSFVARAVDRRLAVTPAGASRWIVSGRTSELLAWLAEVWVKSPEEVMQVFGWTPESIAAEDAPATTVPVNVSVQLPDRKTTSEIARNAAGDITQVIQLETSTT